MMLAEKIFSGVARRLSQRRTKFRPDVDQDVIAPAHFGRIGQLSSSIAVFEELADTRKRVPQIPSFCAADALEMRFLVEALIKHRPHGNRVGIHIRRAGMAMFLVFYERLTPYVKRSKQKYGLLHRLVYNRYPLSDGL